ncbi:hypothetical protein HYZ98_00085 [Candidatus Peregrinibacteria bacterium]|nr:hypothetical protein [Candidatus Peregrinibacteria bacterium]
MQQTTFVDRYALLWTTLWGFVSWYIGEKPVRIFQRYWDYTTAFAEIFSFIFLLKTLFAPWKNITDVKKKSGFDLSQWGQRVVLNITSRVVGMIVRMIALITGVVIEVLLLAGFVFLSVAWFAYPALAVIAVTFLTRSLLS